MGRGMSRRSSSLDSGDVRGRSGNFASFCSGSCFVVPSVPSTRLQLSSFAFCISPVTFRLSCLHPILSHSLPLATFSPCLSPFSPGTSTTRGIALPSAGQRRYCNLSCTMRSQFIPLSFGQVMRVGGGLLRMSTYPPTVRCESLFSLLFSLFIPFFLWVLDSRGVIVFPYELPQVWERHFVRRVAASLTYPARCCI
ncbi:hypothetical protein DFP72DRAFT_205600 [Ephemerocybe angulata]|uniref:Transmembrane protein n=1 Tax=Ephemerocybe angulata TaxID=980116 RepID=A0A8H6MDS4_9AGAR|nr:hypothetical protein DFP72DRAFT_205600 [Tulosesus angulatus]